jgi:hypothetical protein
MIFRIITDFGGDETPRDLYSARLSPSGRYLGVTDANGIIRVDDYKLSFD